MAQVVAAIASGLSLAIDKDHVMTHGEAAANEDGWSPCEKYALWDYETTDGDVRWDLEYLGTSDSPSYNPSATDGTRGGDVLRKKAASAGGTSTNNSSTNSQTSTGKGLAGTLGVRSSKIKDHGSYVELMPSGKTYCEPVYPDYMYVQGNIPNTAVEDTVITSNNNKGTQVENYNIMTSQDMQDLTGIQMNAFTTDKAQALAQRPYNPEKAELEVKVPNAGKPLNNSDPYPVDLKIEELELHLPRTKQYKLPYDKDVGVTKDLASAILILSDFTEKRLVKLENMLATMTRYIFGMGSRMYVNCQYYGGQDHRSWKFLFNYRINNNN